MADIGDDMAIQMPAYVIHAAGSGPRCFIRGAEDHVQIEPDDLRQEIMRVLRGDSQMEVIALCHGQHAQMVQDLQHGCRRIREFQCPSGECGLQDVRIGPVGAFEDAGGLKIFDP